MNDHCLVLCLGDGRGLSRATLSRDDRAAVSQSVNQTTSV